MGIWKAGRSRYAALLGVAVGLSACAAGWGQTGDVNGDGRVDVRDAVLALQITAGLRQPTDSELAAADVYPAIGLGGRTVGDGQVTIDDAVRILRCVLGLLTPEDLRGDSQVMTLAGDPNHLSGWVDGIGGAAQFSEPWTLTVDDQGIVFVADTYNGAIRRVTPDGTVTTVAGDRNAPGRNIRAGYVDGPADRARFNRPQAVAAGPDGSLYVADLQNHAIRRIFAGSVTTLAGNGHSGYRDGVGKDARFREPTGVAVGRRGVYVADSGNHCIRLVRFDGTVTTVAGANQAGYADGPASQARFSDPAGVVVDPQENLFIADCSNLRIRRMSADGFVTTYAGNGKPGTLDGPGTIAQFIFPMGIGLDENGNLYVADWGGPTIRRITTDGWVTTLAGAPGVYGGQDGSASQATFFAAMGVAADRHSHVYISDTDDQSIRRIDLPRP